MGLAEPGQADQLGELIRGQTQPAAQLIHGCPRPRLVIWRARCRSAVNSTARSTGA
jgi:hypothetical protein